MKKRIFFSLLILLLIPQIFTALETENTVEIPENVRGIWSNDDRIIFIGEKDEISIILKLFYGWYYDRASESEAFNNIPERKRNDATSSKPLRLNVKVDKLIENADAYELSIFENEKIIDKIPFCIIDNNIYLSFMIKKDSEITISNPDNQTNLIQGTFYQGVNSKDSICISPQKEKDEIISWFVSDNACYRLRFWKTNMNYDEEAKSSFTDVDRIFTVNKHIFSAGKTFTCSNGRSGRIRNVEKYEKIPFDIVLDKTGSIAAIGKPTFSRALEKYTKEELIAIVNEANSRIHPVPPSPFPVPDFDFQQKKHVPAKDDPSENIDFHWEIIDDMEKDIPEIQEVRKRQKEFGKRGKDIGK